MGESIDDLVEPVEVFDEKKEVKKGKVDTASKGGYSDGELDYMK